MDIDHAYLEGGPCRSHSAFGTFAWVKYGYEQAILCQTSCPTDAELTARSNAQSGQGSAERRGRHFPWPPAGGVSTPDSGAGSEGRTTTATATTGGHDASGVGRRPYSPAACERHLI